MARHLAKKPRYADLAEHVAIIRRHLARTNGATGTKKEKKEAKAEE